MKKEEALVLLDKYLKGECSPQDYQLIVNAYNKLVTEDAPEPSEADYEYSKTLVFNRLQLRNQRIKQVKSRLWPLIAASVAAVTITILGFWLYDISRLKVLPVDISRASQTAKIMPGKNGATVTLGNDRVIKLSDLQSSVLIGEEGMTYPDGKVIVAGTEKMEQSSLVTASTARGQTYIFNLPDGTKVWLNADSKITFQRNFVKQVRMVELEGEAYFEVAKNKKIPFIVNSDSQQIEVLGTHFNVSTYKDDEFKSTTLLEGSVRINGVFLEPNEQALQNKGNIRVRKVDAVETIGWTRGEFICKNERLENIMKDISRWYDVEVVFEDNQLKNKTFSGSVSRYDDIDRLLEGLKYAGINSRIIGGQIIITR